jgi:hypothetical protein
VNKLMAIESVLANEGFEAKPALEGELSGMNTQMSSQPTAIVKGTSTFPTLKCTIAWRR